MSQANLTPKLVRWYIHNGMPQRLAEAVLVCRYLEALLADVPAAECGRIAPLFDHDAQLLRDDWRRCRRYDLWLDGTTAEVVSALPPSEGEPDLYHYHLPIDAQAGILFGRFANLFR